MESDAHAAAPHASQRLNRPALVLVLMALLAYTYWVPRGPLANADTRVALTRAIVDDHSLRIDRYAAGLTDRSAFRGHYFTDKDPGVSFLAVPVYAVLRWVLPSTYFTGGMLFVVRFLLTAGVVSLPAAVFVGMFFRSLVSIAGRRRAALLALGYAFGTMAWALSALMFSHVLAAMCVFIAFVLLQPDARHRTPDQKRWVGAGALCGFAVCLEYPAGLVAAVLGLFAVHVSFRGGWRRGVWFMAVLGLSTLLGAAPTMLYNLTVYGNLLSQGYAHLHGAAQFRAGMSHGLEGVSTPDLGALWGITVSPYRGLFVLSPFLLLALPGLGAMWRRKRRASAVVCASAVTAMLLFNSSYYFWDGGVSLGPRHFTPALPFLAYPVAFAMRKRPWSVAAPGLIWLSVAIVGICCVTVLVFLPGVQNPILDLAVAHLLHGPTPNNWGMVLGLHGAWSLAPLAFLECGLGAALRRSLASRMPARARFAASPVDERVDRHVA